MLLGDFNIDLLNFDTFDHTNTFFDDLASNSLQSQNFTFCNIPNLLVKTAIPGNISSNILDHLSQFLYYGNYQLNIPLCPMTGKTLTNNYLLMTLKRQTGIEF